MGSQFLLGHGLSPWYILQLPSHGAIAYIHAMLGLLPLFAMPFPTPLPDELLIL